MANVSLETAEGRICPMSMNWETIRYCQTTRCMAWRKLVRVDIHGLKTIDHKSGRCGMVQDYYDHN